MKRMYRKHLIYALSLGPKFKLTIKSTSRPQARQRGTDGHLFTCNWFIRRMTHMGSQMYTPSLPLSFCQSRSCPRHKYTIHSVFIANPTFSMCLSKKPLETHSPAAASCLMASLQGRLEVDMLKHEGQVKHQKSGTRCCEKRGGPSSEKLLIIRFAFKR